MYRQGLGDCFLVTFDPGGNEVHLLIDCGSLGATTTGVKMDAVVADILKTTGYHVHVVAATHEHKDHLSGFYFDQKSFKELQVDHVWLAWTENAQDPLAQKLGKPGDLALTLAQAAKALTQAKDSRSAALGQAIHDVLGFAGDPDALGAGALAKTVNAAMDFVREGFGAKVQFHYPGREVLEPDWVPGFRFYVLGPPYSEAALQDTGETGSAELYGLA